MRYLFGILLVLFGVAVVQAEVETKTVTYQDGDVTLEGFVAWDPDKTDDEAPGVLVVHQWMGLTDYEKNRCQQLAELGYVAFAVDIYGKGIRPIQSARSRKTRGRIQDGSRTLSPTD